MVWMLVVLYLLIIFIEVPTLIRKRMYPELGAFWAVFMIGLYMSLGFYYQWPLGPFEALMKYLQGA